MSFFRDCTLQLEAVPELGLIASGGAVLKMGVCIMGSNLSPAKFPDLVCAVFTLPWCPDFSAASAV